MNEKLLEKKLREGVKVKGGIALKLTSISLTGLPDRLVLLPGGRVKFAELKSTGKKKIVEKPVKVLRQMDFFNYSDYVLACQEIGITPKPAEKC